MPQQQQAHVNDGSTALPELKSTYHDSYGGSGGYMSPAWKPPPHQSLNQRMAAIPPSPRNMETSRLDFLEERLSSQERTAQSLLDKAMKIKEDVVDNLNLTHSTWQGEKRQRELLQEHIRSITDLVRKLDRDIKVLEDQVRLKDGVLTAASSNIKTLELQQATALTDIRGRVARCDAGISKLAADQRGHQDGIRQANSQQLDRYQRLQEKIQALEIKILESSQKQMKPIRGMESSREPEKKSDASSASAINLLDTKYQAAVNDLSTKISVMGQKEEAEREKSLTKLTITHERQDAIIKTRLDKMETRLDTALRQMSHEIGELKSKIDGSLVERSQLDLERRLIATFESAMRDQQDKFSQLKRECRQGFATVHDSMTNSKQVLEGKLTLSEEQLRKEMAHIRKMVVLV